jgi:hypothetical protein
MRFVRDYQIKNICYSRTNLIIVYSKEKHMQILFSILWRIGSLWIGRDKTQIHLKPVKNMRGWKGGIDKTQTHHKRAKNMRVWKRVEIKFKSISNQWKIWGFEKIRDKTQIHLKPVKNMRGRKGVEIKLKFITSEQKIWGYQKGLR